MFSFNERQLNAVTSLIVDTTRRLLINNCDSVQVLMKFAFRSSRQPMSTERETTKRSLSQSVMQSVMQWSCLLFAQRCVCVMPWDDALPLLIMCYRFHFFSLLLPQLKYSTLNAERHKKLLCMSWERIHGEIQGEFREILSLFYALQFQFFMR